MKVAFPPILPLSSFSRKRGGGSGGGTALNFAHVSFQVVRCPSVSERRRIWGAGGNTVGHESLLAACEGQRPLPSLMRGAGLEPLSGAGVTVLLKCPQSGALGLGCAPSARAQEAIPSQPGLVLLPLGVPAGIQAVI